MKASCLLLWCLCCTVLMAQEQLPTYLKGRLVHDSLDLSNIHVVNKTRGSATITDSEGVFEIAVVEGDQLFISAVQIFTRKLVVSQAMLQSELIRILVEPFVNELNEVVLRPYGLSGGLTNDSKQAPKAKVLNFDDLGIPGYKGIRREKIKTVGQMALDLATLKLDVEALYNHLSGYYVRLRKKRMLDNRFELVLQMIQFYGLHFLMDQYRLAEEQVYEFVIGTVENYPVEEKFRKGAHSAVLEYFEMFNREISSSE
ncbi:MAG: hypothetical protein ACON42_01230 [Flavobacteriaceae bacterium]